MRSQVEPGRASGQETLWVQSVCVWGYHRDYSIGVDRDKDGWAEKGQIRQGHKAKQNILDFVF